MISVALGDRVRIRYTGCCDFCTMRDPNRVLEGQTGTVASLMSSAFNHPFEVLLDGGPLRQVKVPYFETLADLPSPNFAADELEPLER